MIRSHFLNEVDSFQCSWEFAALSKTGFRHVEIFIQKILMAILTQNINDLWRHKCLCNLKCDSHLQNKNALNYCGMCFENIIKANVSPEEFWSTLLLWCSFLVQNPFYSSYFQNLAIFQMNMVNLNNYPLFTIHRNLFCGIKNYHMK